MRRTLALITVIAIATTAQTGNTYPEGAPWGAADPAAAEHCASCHWERKPQPDSTQVRVKGLPDFVVPGQRYPLVVTLDDSNMATSGLQVIAVAQGQPAGSFTIAQGARMETAALGTMLRSTAPKSALAKRVSWTFVWQAPAKVASPVFFFVAVSASNDDGSPFGDTIHYRRFEVAAVR